MFKGIVVENSLADRKILDRLKIINIRKDEDWTLRDVLVTEKQIQLLQSALADGPWYIHFWEGDVLIVVYRDKMFRVSKTDTPTWKEAREHGNNLHIPKEQLDFLTGTA